MERSEYEQIRGDQKIDAFLMTKRAKKINIKNQQKTST